MYKVIESFEQIGRKLGVTFHYHSPVSRIEVNTRNATGVILENGERMPADVVIANADLPYVYDQLLPDDGSAARLNKKKYTSSALMYYWGVKGERSQALMHHNVFLADHEYRQSFDQIFRDHTLPDDPSFYVCAPTRTDPSFAPENGDSLMILVPVGHIDDNTPQDWGVMQERAKESVLRKLGSLGITNLKDRIFFEKRFGPADYQAELNLAKGSAFGLSHNFLQVGYLRPHNRHARYGNLYFTGASTHPGTGLPIVLLSAQLTVERILKEQPIPSRTSLVVQRQLVERV